MEDFKVQDSVQLLHGKYSPIMTIAEINTDKQEARCVWYDHGGKTKDIKINWIPFTALKHTPPEPPRLSKDDILNPLRR